MQSLNLLGSAHDVMGTQHLQNGKHHESDPPAEVMAASFAHRPNPGNYSPPPTPAPLLNVSCKMQTATFEKAVASVTDGARGPGAADEFVLDEPTHIGARDIGARHQSPPPSPPPPDLPFL